MRGSIAVNEDTRPPENISLQPEFSILIIRSNTAGRGLQAKVYNFNNHKEDEVFSNDNHGGEAGTKVGTPTITMPTGFLVGTSSACAIFLPL